MNETKLIVCSPLFTRMPGPIRTPRPGPIVPDPDTQTGTFQTLTAP